MAVRSVRYRDESGRPTDDPSIAASGEVVERDDRGHIHRRTPFFLTRHELPWLPVGEAALLVWVLVALIAVWLVIGLVLRLT